MTQSGLTGQLGQKYPSNRYGIVNFALVDLFISRRPEAHDQRIASTEAYTRPRFGGTEISPNYFHRL